MRLFRVSVNLLVAFVLGMVSTAILTNSWNNAAAAEQENQLRTRDVLAIIARPLESSSQGFYLPNVDLHNANLIGVDFSSALLSYSDMSGAFLLNANLSHASLHGANLSSAELSNANLSNAWLFEANLQNAMIAYANLDGANFEDANLVGADLESSSLRGVNLIGADVADASFSFAIIEDVILPNGQAYAEGDDLVTLFGARSNP